MDGQMPLLFGEGRRIKMAKSKNWGYSEKRLLLDNYETMTIKELEEMFPNRTRESINNKIKRLKRSGEILDGKDDNTIKRAYKQRGIDLNNI